MELFLNSKMESSFVNVQRDSDITMVNVKQLLNAHPDLSGIQKIMSVSVLSMEST